MADNVNGILSPNHDLSVNHHHLNENSNEVVENDISNRKSENSYLDGWGFPLSELFKLAVLFHKGKCGTQWECNSF